MTLYPIQNTDTNFSHTLPQSMSSDYPEVLKLVGALATKVSESLPNLSAQAIGSALYGLQKLSSDKLEVLLNDAIL
jgi:hypothetical protein